MDDLNAEESWFRSVRKIKDKNQIRNALGIRSVRALIIKDIEIPVIGDDHVN